MTNFQIDQLWILVADKGDCVRIEYCGVCPLNNKCKINLFQNKDHGIDIDNHRMHIYKMAERQLDLLEKIKKWRKITNDKTI